MMSAARVWRLVGGSPASASSRTADLSGWPGLFGQVCVGLAEEGGQSPAAAASAAALSVFSQVNEGSSRPKWP